MNRFCPLASGSKGNCTYLQTKEMHVLIDAGISARAISAHLKDLNTSIEEIDAIFVTHEHIDHIRALKILSERHGIPVICNRETAKGICKTFETHKGFQFKLFTTGDPFTFGDIEVFSFGVQHDASEPVGFRLETEAWTIGMCTDIGSVNEQVLSSLKGCDLLLIEANHEPEFVFASPRSTHYKERVVSRFGHLSNSECGKLIRSVWSEKLKKVYLAHLSSECNSIDKALAVVGNELKGLDLEVHVVMQDRASDVLIASETLQSS